MIINLRFSFSLLIFLFLLPGVRADESVVHYTLHREVINVNSIEGGYTSSVLCRGKFTALQGRETVIRYSGLESLGGIHGTYRNGSKKFKPLPENDIHATTLAEGDQTDENGKYVLSWPSKGDAAMDFNYTYKLQGSELMTLSTLAINDIIQTDTFDYELRVPRGIQLYFHLPNGGNRLLVDSTQVTAGIIYHFRSAPSSPILLNRNLQPYEYCSFPSRFIQLIFVPEAYRGKAWGWLNDWYQGILKNNPSLSEQNLQILERVTSHTTNPDSIALLLFDYVKTRITYVDEENGLGAFRPKDVNKTLQSRKGDCKDMALLLCEALKHAHIKAWLALSSTLSHECELSFPSLSSSDHMICVAEIGAKKYFLDATDQVCPFGFPSLHIQGRSIFILNTLQGESALVPIVNAASNTSLMELHLHPEGNTLEGTFFYTLHGLSRHEMLQTRSAYSPSEYAALSLQEQRSHTPNISYSNWTTQSADSSDTFSAEIKVDSVLVKIQGKKGITLSFLPFPHKFPKRKSPGTKIILYEAPDNQFDCEIRFDHPVHFSAPDSVHFSQEGFRFDFTVKQKEEGVIHIHYQYIYEDVFIPEEKTATYFGLNALIQKTFHGIIVYE
jgi:hypothetical protein